MSFQGKLSAPSLFCIALLLTGCGKAPESSATEPAMPEQNAAEETAAGDSSTGEVVDEQGKPVLVHLRLVFTDEIKSESIKTHRRLRASLYLQQHALQYGNGQEASYSMQESPVRVMGSLQAQGSVKFKQDDMSQDESYQMAQFWPAMTENPAGRWRIVAPEPSHIGEGVQFKLEMVTPVSGTQHAKISSQGQSFDTEVQQGKPFSCTTTDTKEEQCSLELSFDATPTDAKTEFGETILAAAKTLHQYQGKKGPDGALVMFGSMTTAYGAVTSYEGDKLVVRFSKKFSENLDGADISQELQAVLWTSKPEDDWQPADLPSLTTAATVTE